MKALLRKDLENGFFRLGLRRGMSVMLHSSLASFGEVEGGADSVIDALIDVLGREGTLLMPSFGGPGGVFDRETTPCGLGRIPDVFWRRQGVKRSMHPTHSVAALGRLSDFFLEGHEKALTAYGEGTPYMRLVENEGSVVMAGVDLDRLTLLHSVEAFCAAPYLQVVKSRYLDSEGAEKEAVVEKMAGPHRNFIGLDSALRQGGLMKTARVGSAVCRLLDARRVFDFLSDKMQEKPDLMLCGNPMCADCSDQRGIIRKKELEDEDFTASASPEAFPGGINEFMKLLAREGIRSVEVPAGEHMEIRALKKILEEHGFSVSSFNMGPADPADVDSFSGALEKALFLGAGSVIFSPADKAYASGAGAFAGAAAAAEKKKIMLLIENGPDETCGARRAADIIEKAGRENLRLAFNPANAAFEGLRPFLDLVRNLKYARAVYINDGIRSSPGRFAPPGRGNAEIKEIISALRARSFSGAFTLKAGGFDALGLKEQAGAFRRLLSEI